MTKAKTAKILSAAAVANIAAAGFAAPPANASAHPTTSTPRAATATTPSPALQAARAAAATAKPRGFVPRASSGARINTETGCGGHLCWGLHGGGRSVAYVDEHFFNWTGCHIANFAWGGGKSEFGDTSGSFTPGRYFCAGQDAKWSLSISYTPGTIFCGSFQNVPGGNQPANPGVWCETVR